MVASPRAAICTASQAPLDHALRSTLLSGPPAPPPAVFAAAPSPGISATSCARRPKADGHHSIERTTFKG
eukprot:NODE_16557_length_988_cov_3.616725.p6 GENE.NODE_16557_length_988_cov_3.616725~~NODE_16557_length_988_cov_3.616725.p6  ORF type:complete len:70 (-),score=4.61 NODE_16557_length_988_cov_3.616725:370-579(-)